MKIMHMYYQEMVYLKVYNTITCIVMIKLYSFLEKSVDSSFPSTSSSLGNT